MYYRLVDFDGNTISEYDESDHDFAMVEAYWNPDCAALLVVKDGYSFDGNLPKVAFARA